MAARILDGKQMAASVRGGVAVRVERFRALHGRAPGLAVVRVGDDPASEVYVRSKRKAAAEAGLHAEEHHLPSGITRERILAVLEGLDRRDDIDAVLVQLPLPPHLDAAEVMAAIDPRKDVDGFHPLNAGLLATGRPGVRPCTPAGVMRLLDEAGVPLEGAHAVVLGRSNIVGKPMALMLLERHCTVTVAHSKSRDLPSIVSRADVLVAAVGREGLVRGEWLKPGAAVIDVGMNRVDGRLCGDVDFASAVESAGVITPVPGGVGPMTVAMLLSNAVALAERWTGKTG
jgi:methylenetetrahydrofolate dehydrogenase (NADP+)/methenyltetrahydrofolate cyclohydrolase